MATGTTKRNIDVCFTPALIEYYDIANKNVVLIDILRATSTICTAFDLGVREIIPVASETEALAYKNKGFIVAGERDGKVLSFADFGNSPFNFMDSDIKGKSIAYCTTNGTKAIFSAKQALHLVVGSYLNFSAVIKFLEADDHDVLMLCSGWKNKFDIEDTLFAGAVCDKLLAGGNFITGGDAAIVSVDLWNLAKNDLLAYIDKSDHRKRLKNLGLDDVIEYCHTFDKTEKLPILKGNSIIDSYEVL
ncbi:MAG TPA: 2-phosphosulfolactate phosphatase [Bacteroidales bacterium]|nr:2-phosphosulfolactate phosphatase [Bacteroidales bacterium]